MLISLTYLLPMLSLSVWKRVLCVNFIDLLITYVEPVGVEADVVC